MKYSKVKFKVDREEANDLLSRDTLWGSFNLAFLSGFRWQVVVISLGKCRGPIGSYTYAGSCPKH